MESALIESDKHAVWIGLIRKQGSNMSNDEYRWDQDNTTVSESDLPWIGGDPSGGDQNCIRIKDNTGYAKLADFQCSEDFRYICEMGSDDESAGKNINIRISVHMAKN